MTKLRITIFTLLFLSLAMASGAQTLEEKIKEIDAYANSVVTTHGGPGMAIAIVKDDKVVLAKGYGVRAIGPVPIGQISDSPTAAYKALYAFVKAKDTEGIRSMMSRETQKFAEMVAGRNNQELSRVYSNGFTATTFSATLPEMRNQRIKDSFGAVEVYNAGESKWEDLGFVFEDGTWKLAIGEMFAGTYKSPGLGQTMREANAKAGLPVIVTAKSNPMAPQTPLAVDENTLFAIASNSKAFTTASLAILVDEKKIAWDDKVSKYLPDFQMYDPWVTSELTIRDLVTHRVGLDTFSGDLLWYEANFSADEILKRVRYLKPVSSFRTRYGYQNLMFIAAGKVVEKVAGKPWCAFVREKILDPIGMTRTTCGFGDLGPNAASPHNESGGGKLRVLPHGNVDGGYGAVALNSSVTDLSKWLRLQLGRGKFEGKQIFSEQQSWQMWQPYFTRQVSEAASKNNPTQHFSGVASGWFVNDYHGRKVISHSGGLDGMLSYTVLIPEENVGFVVLTNSEGPGFAIMMNKIRDMFVNAPKRDWNAEGVEQVKRNKEEVDETRKKDDAARVRNTTPSLPLSGYAATYSDKLYGDIRIVEENGGLVMRFAHSPNFVADLTHWHYNTFEIKWRPSVAYNFPRGWVTFTLDKSGKTEELKIDQPNNDFWFYELMPRRVN